MAAGGEVGEQDTAVLIGTSTGMKDIDATAARLLPVPVIDPEVRALDAILDRAGSAPDLARLVA